VTGFGLLGLVEVTNTGGGTTAIFVASVVFAASFERLLCFEFSNDESNSLSIGEIFPFDFRPG